MVGLALLLAMWRLLWEGDHSDRIQVLALWVALPVGAVLGLPRTFRDPSRVRVIATYHE